MPDLHPVLAVLFCMVIGAGFGALNGLLIAFGRVPSIIVTLGTLALFRSFLVEWSDAKTITTASLPQWLVDLPSASAFSDRRSGCAGDRPARPGRRALSPALP